ncbi:hypothetical protein GJW-30_1_03919 [Variibacter gotjawalensis]|uniref:DUF445 domain-containing protein n=2 Tax=Variibacter gotjawalensis TaxID=1333996 RepID=A0A0S3PZM2_9BRAD|nr:uncharacterized membrane-anchored protein YjiN (DUF445 family) [Variibacter gotjawalensis]BAT61362.1 hypothetical protein GJW-30_1_03919 [Variibacter gotjawalensis]
MMRAMSLAALSPDDAEKLSGLRRMKLIATGLLVVSVLLLIAAKILDRRYPGVGFAFVAAFAEAATIGGLADWYAVVALFRRPLGLPIPHTAIIPHNHHRIAESLGTFVETNFLAPEPVKQKLREVDFAILISDWLADRGRSANLSRFVLGLMPQIIQGIEGTGLRQFFVERGLNELKNVDVAPIAANLLGALTDDRRHQSILDEVLVGIGKILSDQKTIDLIRDKIRDELPTLLRLYRADAYLLRKVISSSFSFLQEVQGDPEHPMRSEFDRFITNFVEKLRTSPEYAAKIDTLKQELLARPEIAKLADAVWESLKTFLLDNAADAQSALSKHLEKLLVDVGHQLANSPKIRAEINDGMVMILETFIASQKSGVSRFIADQVKSWDIDQLIRLVEINIGRDLQYIRFNGALVGGLAGLVLYTAEYFLRLN